MYEIQNKLAFRMISEYSEYTKPSSMQNEELRTSKGTMNETTPTHASGEGGKWMGLNGTDSKAIPYRDTTEGDDYHDDGEHTEKKMKRILANRCAARASYRRRKCMISQLSIDLTNLSAKNNEVEAENVLLRNEVRDLKQQVLVLQLMGYRKAMPEVLLSRAVRACLPSSDHTSLPPHDLVAQFLALQHNPWSTTGM